MSEPTDYKDEVARELSRIMHRTMQVDPWEEKRDNFWLRQLKYAWREMFTPPWRDEPLFSRQSTLFRRTHRLHWINWLIGWAWTLAGLLLGAMLAPTLVQWTGHSLLRFEDWLVIGIAVLAGFLVQSIGTLLFALVVRVPFWVSLALFLERHPEADPLGALYGEWATSLGYRLLLLLLAEFVIALLPVLSVAYALYRYVTFLGADKALATTALVGGAIVKLVIIPVLFAIVRGRAFKAFLRWLGINS